MIDTLCASAYAFTLIVILSPFLYHAGAMVHLDGSPGFIDNGWGVCTAQYLLGDIFCHQEMSRSFVVNGNQMPFCIRDVGIFAGICIGSTVLSSVRRTLNGHRMVPFGIALIAVMVLEWAYGSACGDTAPLRFVSGILAGIGISVTIVCYIDSMYKNG